MAHVWVQMTARRCSACGFENPARFKFCGECGTSLVVKGGSPPPEPAVTTRTTPAAGQAERRQLSVVFCDIVGSTTLAREHDPEEWRELVRAYHAACADVIRRYDGYMAQYLGDGVLVYFGYPRAHEDDAARAVRTGLGILEAMSGVNRMLHDSGAAGLQVRVGIHTGLVVVGEVGSGDRHEQLALGDTPNLAARLQGLAEPDSVVISAATRKLVHGLFVCEDLGLHEVRGFSEPVAIYRVRQASGIRGRFGVHGADVPLVGREDEIAALNEAWRSAKDGRGRVVLLAGEPGIGKSRLVQALHENVAADAHTWLDCRCSPYHKNSALFPVIELLQEGLLWSREAPEEENVARLDRALRRFAFDLHEDFPLFAQLLGVRSPERYPSSERSPEMQRRATIEALLRWLFTLASGQPLILAVEDLHWADPSTLELLEGLVSRIGSASILLVVTARPELRSAWTAAPEVRTLSLSRLTPEQAVRVVEQVAGQRRVPEAWIRQIVAKTDGVPLFAEEMTRALLESSGVGLDEHVTPALAIPDTLHQLLMARLDQFRDAKEAAQLGACIGREFDFALLHAISGWEEHILLDALARLVEADLLRVQGEPPRLKYSFRHALIQDAAYQSLLKSRRRKVHADIARLLRGPFAAAIAGQPEVLARHFTEAGMIDDAVEQWQLAGQRAIEQSAFVEAAAHFGQALDLLRQGPERPSVELALQIQLGHALRATRGYAALEVEHVYARARELCGRTGETLALFPVLSGLWLFYMNRADLRTARDLAAQLGRLAESVPASVFEMAAGGVQGITAYYLGELEDARAHLERAIELYDRSLHDVLTAQFGQDPGIVGLTYSARVLALLGYPERAAARIKEAISEAETLGHKLSLMLAYSTAALVAVWFRDGEAALRWSDAAIHLAERYGFTQYRASNVSMRGWGLLEVGEVERAVEHLEQGEQAYQATGAHLGRPDSLTWVALAYARRGDAGGAQRVISDALATVQRTGEQMTEAEIHRVRGELLLASDPLSAERCFQNALDIARRQRARWWELRSASSLARLWIEAGRKEEAYRLLRPLCEFFEGQETRDVREAVELLHYAA